MTGDNLSWQVGDVRVTRVMETVMYWPFGALLPDATPEVVDSVAWMRPHFVDERGKMILSMHTLVVESEGKRILVDTCIGNDKPRPTRPFNQLSTDFLDNLSAAGFPPEAIDIVLCTHMHVDHVGWNTRLVDGRWVPTFPNARHLFNRTEYEHWTANPEPEVFGDVMGDSVAPVIEAGMADFVAIDHAVTSEVRLEPTPGHTPGHCCVHISSGGQEAVITGDMTHSPIQWAVPMTSSADWDKELGLRTRAEFCRRYGDTATLVIGTHFNTPTAGHIVADGDTWRFAV
jgi:glyoxylase-like metal-dependent hydrolase (beta-lactamase superfamily II)